MTIDTTATANRKSTSTSLRVSCVFCLCANERSPLVTPAFGLPCFWRDQWPIKHRFRPKGHFLRPDANTPKSTDALSVRFAYTRNVRFDGTTSGSDPMHTSNNMHHQYSSFSYIPQREWYGGTWKRSAALSPPLQVRRLSRAEQTLPAWCDQTIDASLHNRRNTKTGQCTQQAEHPDSRGTGAPPLRTATPPESRTKSRRSRRRLPPLETLPRRHRHSHGRAPAPVAATHLSPTTTTVIQAGRGRRRCPTPAAGRSPGGWTGTARRPARRCDAVRSGSGRAGTAGRGGEFVCLVAAFWFRRGSVGRGREGGGGGGGDFVCGEMGWMSSRLYAHDACEASTRREQKQGCFWVATQFLCICNARLWYAPHRWHPWYVIPP